jgi:GNAT superfamily N-acetyltransferase
MTGIRPASPADADALASLRWEFRAGRAPTIESRDAFVKRCAVWMARELAPEQAWRAWVAVTDAAIVGHVWVQTIEKIPNPVQEGERHAYLSNFYVQPSARGGTGTRMLETALAWARANGIDRVILWPSARRITLYERHGFRHQGDVMELKVGGGK